MSGDIAAAVKYFRRQAAVDQRLIDRAQATPGDLRVGVEDLERRRDLWIQLADEADAYLAAHPDDQVDPESTPPPVLRRCSSAQG